MKKNYPFLMFTLVVTAFVIPSFFSTNAIKAQQSIGAHPSLDAGFESQPSGNLGTTQNATDWTYVSNGSTQSRAISLTGGNGGPRFLSVGRGNTTSSSSTTVNSNQITTGTFLANTSYIVQFHYRQSTGFTGNPDTTSYVFISSDGTSPGRKTTKINLGTPPANWSIFSTVVTTDNTTQATTGTCGINIKNQQSPSVVATTIDVDNFVIYPADNQSSPAPDVTAPNPVSGVSAIGRPAVIDVSWTAPAAGVDGGGYMVVRFTADPSAEPNPIQNAVYKASATNTIGATGTVVYVGPSTSFSDATTVSGTNYWYRVYTVDKAFNYSTAAATGPVSSLSKVNYYYDGSGPTDVLTNWWTNKNGTGSNPPDFTSAGQIFRIVTNADLTPTLAISGSGSFLIIGEPAPGVPAMTVNFNSTTLPGIDTIYQSSDGNPTVLNFNTSTVPSINQLFDIFTHVHYRTPGTSVGTSKVYDKIFVENNADVIFTGSPTVTSSFQVDAGSAATIGVLSSRWLTVNTGATVTINGKLTTPKLAGLVSTNVGTPANTFGAIQFVGAGDIVLGPTSTIEYSSVSTSTSQTITPRTDYANIIISGPGVSKTFSGPTTLSGSLTLNTSSLTGSILSGGTLKVNGDLILTSGYLNTDAVNILELGTASNIVGGSNASHIVGPMKRNIASTSSTLFPVGKGGVYGPVAVTPTSSAASVYRAEYFNIPYSNLTVVNPLTAVSNAGYCDVAKLSGSDAAVSLILNGTAVPGATNIDELVVARFNGTSWVSVSATPINPGDATTGTATSGSLTAYGSFAFGIKPTSIVPLTFLSFNGAVKNGIVSLYWTAAEEKNVSSYNIEQSKDGRAFVTIGNVKAINSGYAQKYSYTNPYDANGNNYYRVKAVDRDGKVQYTNVLNLKSSNRSNVVVLNNIITDNVLHLQLSGLAKGNYELNIVNAAGNVVQHNKLRYEEGTLIQNIQLSNTLSKGLYFLTLVGSNTSECTRIILQ